MSSFRRLAGVAVSAVLVAAPSAARATVIGSIDPSNTDPGSGGLCVSANVHYLQAGVAPGDPTYTVPLGGGTITGWSTRYGVSGATMGLEVWRANPSVEGRYKLIGVDDEMLAPDGQGVSSFSAAIPVQAGDVLGVHQPVANTTHCTFNDPHLNVNAFVFPYIGSVSLGASADFSESNAIFDDSVNVSATIQQTADVSVTAAATPTQVPVGDLAQLLFTASNAGPAASPATFTANLPSGLSAVSAVAQGGSCTVGTVVSCQLTGVAAGGSSAVLVNVRGTAPGRYTTNSAIVGLSSNFDPQPLNNAASVALTVLPSSTPRPLTCTVPKLVGHSLAFAKTTLSRAHCRLGVVRRPRHPKGTLVIVSESPSPGQVKTSGTQVSVKLGPKPRKKH